MIKIRYCELPPGLHVIAERQGRGTVIYLLPGLSQAQRQAALIRVRSSGRLGHGPAIPAFDLAIAIAGDKVRITVRNGAVAMRGHPALLLPPLIVLFAGVIVFSLMSFVRVTVGPPAIGTGVPVVGFAGARPGDNSDSTDSPSGGANSGSPGSDHGTSRSPGPSPSPSPTASRSTGLGRDPSGTGPAASPSPSPASSPGGPASPQPSPSASPSGNCLKVGRITVCVSL